MNSYQDSTDYGWLNAITSMMATVMATAFMARLVRKMLAVEEPALRSSRWETLPATTGRRVRRIGARSVQDIAQADQDAIMELRHQGRNIGDIAWRVGYSPEEVFRVVWRYAFAQPDAREKLVEEYRDLQKERVLAELRSEKLVTEDEATRIHEMWNQGLNMMQIAAITGRGQTTIHRVLSHPPRPPKRRTQEETRQLMERIIELRMRRLPLRAIAEQLGVHESQVFMLLRRAGLVIDTGDPARTIKLLKGQMHSIYHRVAGRPTEDAMRQAVRDLEDVATMALVRVESMPEEWRDAEPDDWWQLGWLRHCALVSIGLLETAIANRQALEGRGPLMRVMGPSDWRLSQVRARLHRSIRGIMQFLRAWLLYFREEAEDEEAIEAVRWAQTLLIQAGTEGDVLSGVVSLPNCLSKGKS